MPSFARPGAFAKDIRAEGARIVAAMPAGRFADRRQLTRAAVFLCLFVATYAATLAGGLGVPMIVMAAACGLSAFLFGVTVAHDAAHGALHRNRRVNRVALFLGFGIFGISGTVWAWRHNRLHHVFPNVQGTDIDHEATPLLRLSPHSRWCWWHRYQKAYATVLYAFLMGSVTWVEDFFYLRSARRDAPRDFATAAATAEFIATKVFHVGLALVVPWMCLDISPAELAAGYLVATCLPSLLFSALVVGTHIAEEADFHAPAADGTLPHDWAVHQMVTSVDWSPRNVLAGILTGGANAHTAHHLFPQVAHCHVPRLNRLVEEMVARHGVRRNVLSFTEMIASHYRLLGRLARPAVPH